MNRTVLVGLGLAVGLVIGQFVPHNRVWLPTIMVLGAGAAILSIRYHLWRKKRNEILSQRLSHMTEREGKGAGH